MKYVKDKVEDEHENCNSASQEELSIISDNINLNVPIYQLPYALWTSLSLTQ